MQISDNVPLVRDDFTLLKASAKAVLQAAATDAAAFRERAVACAAMQVGCQAAPNLDRYDAG